jgi:hypothetical protein
MGNFKLLENALPVVMLFHSQYEEAYIFFPCIMKFVLHQVLQFSKCNLCTLTTCRPTLNGANFFTTSDKNIKLLVQSKAFQILILITVICVLNWLKHKRSLKFFDVQICFYSHKKIV